MLHTYPSHLPMNKSFSIHSMSPTHSISSIPSTHLYFDIPSPDNHRQPDSKNLMVFG